MALLLVDGFEQYNATTDLTSTMYQGANPGPGYWAASASTGWSTLTTTPIHTTQVNTTSKSISHRYDSFMHAAIPSSTTIVIGFAVYQTNWGAMWSLRSGWSGNIINAAALGGGGINGVYLESVNTGALRLRLNNSGWSVVFTGTAGRFTLNTWYYVETKVVFGTTTGSIELRIDGVAAGSATNMNTANGITGGFENVAIGSATYSSADYNYFDDVYILNNTGTTHTDFLGPINLYTMAPSGAGSSTGMTPSTGNNWDCVNDFPANTTDYVSASAADVLDLYTFPSLPGSVATVHAVGVGNQTRKNDTGTRQMQNVINLSGTETNGTITQPVLNSFRWGQDIFAEKPGGGAWTPTDVNSLQFGVRSK